MDVVALITGITGTGILGSVGGGIVWLSKRSDARALTREQKLDRYQADLDAREKRIDDGQTAYTQRLEARLTSIEQRDLAREVQLRALRLAFELVSAALRSLAPDHTALRQAEQLLTAAFPIDAAVPPDMTATLAAIK